MLRFVQDDVTECWELYENDELLGSSALGHNASLDAFACNWPEHGAWLDAQKQPETCSEPARRAKHAGTRKMGSGARFRELIGAGASNADALTVVRAEFPDSKATLSDAAWNRAQIEKAARDARPFEIDDLL